MKNKKLLNLLFGVFIFFCVVVPNNNLNAKTNKHDSIVFYYLDTISYYLDSLKVEEQSYVLAQAILETGWFQCKNCAWSNGYNLFGFRGKNGYIKYKSWKESVIAYADWQKKRWIPYKEKHPKNTYLDFLIWCKYAEGSGYNKYISTIRNWLLKNWYKTK